MSGWTWLVLGACVGIGWIGYRLARAEAVQQRHNRWLLHLDRRQWAEGFEPDQHPCGQWDTGSRAGDIVRILSHAENPPS